MKIDNMGDHSRVQDDGDQSGSGQDRDDADVDAAPGEPFHSAALQQEIGMSQEGMEFVRTTKILTSSLDGNKCPECGEMQRKSGFFVGIKETGRPMSPVSTWVVVMNL